MFTLKESMNNNNLEYIKECIFRGANIYENGNYAEIVELILETKMNWYEKKSALLNNVYFNRVNIVRIILKHGIDIIIVNKAIKKASYHGSLEMITLLTVYGANISADNDFVLRNILETYYEKEYENKCLSIVKYLVNNGANVDANNGEPLYICAKHGSFKITKYLIKMGANIHIDDDEPLRANAMYLCKDGVKYLIKKGANIYSNDHYLLSRCFSNFMSDIFDFLIPRYGINELKNALMDEYIRKKMLEALLRKDVSKYKILIDLYREFGIDVYELIEKEQ